MTNDQARELLRRLNDYDNGAIENQKRLIARWKAAHPLAAAEQSAALKPLMRMEEWRPSNKNEPDEIWFNDTYNVTVRRRREDRVFGSGEMLQLGISSFDGTARHDWREFQAIKNQLAGAECEAFELYPAESRLLDPSNYYSLWCFPGIKAIKVGHARREVKDADAAWAPQRALPAQPSPPDAVPETPPENGEPKKNH